MKKLSCAVSVLAVSTAHAGVNLHVDDDAPPGGDGLSWASAYQDLQDALDEALGPAFAAGEIRVAQGTYFPTVELIPRDSRSASFQLLNDVAIRGGYAGLGAPDPDDRDTTVYETILSGDIGVPDDNSDNIYRIVSSGPGTDSTAVLDGFTISQGHANGPGDFDMGPGLTNNGGSPTITSCLFSDNVASSVCGAVYNAGGSPTFTQCRFERNSGERGGAVCNISSDAAFIDCHFEQNVAVEDGGAVLNAGSAPTFVGCVFVANLVEGGSAQTQGGAVSNVLKTTASFSECVFTDNTAEGGGGVRNNASTPTFTGCEFSGNNALQNGGGMLNHSSGHPTVIDSLFFENEAGVGGGGTLISGGSATFIGCVFESNTTSGDGAGMRVTSSQPLTVIDCVFRNNTAAGGGKSNGGGLYDGGNASVIALNCTFEGNYADNVGGGSFHLHDGSEIVGCLYQGNTAGNDGGGIYNVSARNLFEDCTLVGNQAIRGGGAFFSDEDPTLRRCRFLNNNALGDGGGLHTWDDTTVSVLECVFLGNTAVGYGGAVRNGDNAEPEFVNCIFSGNEANSGAGMANLGSSEPTVIGCSFSHNSAALFAGGIYASGPAMTLVNSVLWGNTDDTGFTEIAQVFTGAPGILVDYCCVEGLTGFLGGVGNTGADPMFVDALGPDGTWGTADDDLRLQAGSTLIDAGDNEVVPVDTTTDLGGDPRFAEDLATTDTGNGECPIVDMGAYEFPASCPWDLDCGGNVGITDFLELLAAWGTNPGGPPDFNGDGNVGIEDFLELLANWGPCL